MSRWADADDDESPPPPPKIDLDPSGTFKLVTTYSVDKIGNKKKTVVKVLVQTEIRRIPLRVLHRKKVMKPFGKAAEEIASSPTGEQENVTITSKDEVKIEHPKSTDPNAAEGEGDIDPTKALFGGGADQINAFWQKQQRRQLERKYDVGGDGAGGEGGDGAAADGAGGDAASSGKYVPPSLRGGLAGAMSGKTLEQRSEMLGERGPGGGRDDDTQQMNTIRVTNISEETTESDLSDLFTPFGRISRVYLAKDKETLQSRGFAFISFVHHDDAKNAMAKLQGFGYDHLILKLEWARPGGSGGGPGGGAGGGGGERTEFRSGYGKALAQDTKEKVSFASNLTAGTRN